jgi:hypothetical protein
VKSYHQKLTLPGRHWRKEIRGLTFFSFIYLSPVSICSKFKLETGSGQSTVMPELAGTKVNFSVSTQICRDLDNGPTEE